MNSSKKLVRARKSIGSDQSLFHYNTLALLVPLGGDYGVFAMRYHATLIPGLHLLYRGILV